MFAFADKTEKLLFLLAAISGVVASALYPVAFWIYGNVIKIIIDYTSKSGKTNTISCRSVYDNVDDVTQAVYPYILYYVFFGIGIVFSHFLAYFLWGIASERNTKRLRNSLYISMIRQEIAWFESYNVGESAALFGLIEKIKVAYGVKLSDFFVLMTRSIACLTFAYYSCWKLALALTALLPLSTIFFVLTIIFMKKYTVQENKAAFDLNSLAEEVLTKIKVVIAYCAEKTEIKNYSDLLTRAKDVTIKKGLILGMTSGISSFFSNASYPLLIAYGTYLYQNDCSFSSGNIIQTFSALIIATISISQALPFFKEYGEGSLAKKKIAEIINRKSKLDVFDPKGEILSNDQMQGEIEFRDIFFMYPSITENQKRKMVLKNLNFKIPVGQTVAFCGTSGCGKSTLSRLLMRYYEPLAGDILCNGKDIQMLNLSWWRSQISVVSHEAALFSVSIKDNIRIARPDATDAEIYAAAKAASADEFINKLKNGYDTIVGNEVDLSGGQKQRIAIARAFLRNSKILIFDEATSALDNESESKIQESMERLKRGKTTIIIAHRLTTIKDADIIYEMQSGSISDYGTHEQLMTRRGYYYSLATEAKEEKTTVKKIKRASTKKKPQSDDEEDDYYEENMVDDTSSKEKMVSPPKKLKNIAYKVWSLNRPELFWILLSGVASFVQGAIFPFLVFSFCQLIEIFSYNSKEKQTNVSLMYMGITLALSLISLFAQFFLTFATTKSGIELITRIKRMIFESVVYKDFAWFSSEEHKPSVIVTNLATKAPLIKGYTAERIGIVANFISSVGIPLGMSFYFSWKLALVISSFIPVALMWGFMQGQFLKNNQKLSGTPNLQKGLSLATETINNIYTVTSLNVQNYYVNVLTSLFDWNLSKTILLLSVEGFFYAVGYSLYYFVQAATYGYGIVLLKNNEIEAKAIVLIYLSILYSSMYFGKYISVSPDIPKAKRAARWAFQIIYKDLPKIDSKADTGLKLTNFKGDIQFNNVSFKYPLDENDEFENPYILKGIDLKFNHNESNALVGNSGGGKSTVISLVARYFDPNSGTVTVDGHNMKNVNARWLRSQIGIVFQEPNLFSRSVQDNIGYGLTNVTTDDIIKAAQQAKIHDKIISLPDGYNTSISSMGFNFSSGEKQRISIARALIRNPKILLLDEATAALDNNTEKQVQNVIDEASSTRTSIMIAHRLSTIRNVNKIYVIKDGTLIEQGSHDALMNNKKFYYELNNYH